MTNHTDTSRSGDLVAKLRDEDSYYRLQEKHWCIDAEELERQRLAAADRIEALEAALRDLIEAVQRRTSDLGGYDGRFGLNKAIVKARAALGEKQ